MSIRSHPPARGALVILLLCLSPLRSIGEDPSFVWPARIEPAMTSSFGEWRSGHIHAGVDVKTWGRIGVPLLAVADGYVQRVRTSPWGYGKVFYLALSNGTTAVYGHVDRFTTQLDDLVWAQQCEEGHYSVDIWLKEGEYPVRRGDTVAYSGDTGTAAPHLHFELRDENNIPLNPLLHGLSVDDSIPPVPQFLLIRPVGSDSRVEGDVKVRRFGVSPLRSGGYRLRGRPEIEGNIGISVAAYDRMDGVWNRFSPYRLLLEVDGRETFEVRYDQFSYEVSDLINLDRDYRYMVREGARAHTLYKMTGNELPFYGDYEEGAGYLRDLEPGLHQLRVTVADAFGNEAHVEGEILLNRPPTLHLSSKGGEGSPDIAGWVEDPDGDEIDLVAEALYLKDSSHKWERLPDDSLVLNEGRFHVSPALLDSLASEGGWVVRVRAVDGWGRSAGSEPVSLGNLPLLDPGPAKLALERYEGFFILSARPENPVPGRVTFTVRQGESPPVTIDGVEQGGSRFRAVYPLKIVSGREVEIMARFEPVSGSVAETSVLRRVIPLPASESSVYESPDGILRLDFPAGSVFEDSFVQGSEVREFEDVEEQGLVVLSGSYEIGPQDILFRRGAELTMVVTSVPENVRPRQVGLYTHDGNEDDRRWFNLGGALEGDVLKTDVGGLGPFAVLADTTRPELRLLFPRDGSRLRNTRPTIAFEVDDNASGFSEETQFVLRLNGTQVIARYDPQHDRLIYVPRDSLDPGDYRVNLEVTDNAGNVGRVSSTFTIAEGEG